MDLSAVNRQWDQIRGGLARLRSWFELCRLPWSLAVAADPLAGALVAGAGWRQLPFMLLLMLGAVLLHAGAVALNDWHDLKADRIERPDRPLPAGRVGRWYCLAVAVALLIGGETLMSSPGMEFGQVGLLIVCAILLYEFLIKEAPIARAVPGMARALAMLSGMMFVPAAESAGGWPLRLFFMCVLATYSLGTMILAYRAADDERRMFAAGGAIVAGVAVIAIGLTRLFFAEAARFPSAAIWIGVLLVLTVLPVGRAIVRPAEAARGPAAGSAMLGTILIGATAVAFVRGLPLSLPVAAILLPVFFARRWLATPAEPRPSANGQD